MLLSRQAILSVCLLVIFSFLTLSVSDHSLNANSPAAAKQTISLPETTLTATPSLWPISGAITSNFGWRSSPAAGASEDHQGIDIAGDVGLPVVATADGRVVKSGWTEGYGILVEIDHGNGLSTIYGHNSQSAVSPGQNVQKGQLIAYVGNTGKSTGPHLHYEVKQNGISVNPLLFLLRLN